MKTVAKIIAARGGLDALKDRHIDPAVSRGVSPDLSTWQPISWRQGDSIREAVWVTARQIQIDPRALRELQQFARLWDRNLRAQGFLTVPQGSTTVKGGGLTR